SWVHHPENRSVTPLALLDLLFALMLFQQFPVRIDLEAPLFPIRSDDDFIVPLAIRVVFPFYLNDLSPGCLFVDCLLDRDGDRLYLDHLSRLLSQLRGRAESKAGADRCG